MLNFNRFSTRTIATAYNNILGTSIDAVDAVEIRESLNAGWLLDDTEKIYDECVEIERRKV